MTAVVRMSKCLLYVYFLWSFCLWCLFSNVVYMFYNNNNNRNSNNSEAVGPAWLNFKALAHTGPTKKKAANDFLFVCWWENWPPTEPGFFWWSSGSLPLLPLTCLVVDTQYYTMLLILLHITMPCFAHRTQQWLHQTLQHLSCTLGYTLINGLHSSYVQ